MKEYLLLLFIALVGLFGLFSIHHEFRVNELVEARYVDFEGIRTHPAAMSAVRAEHSGLMLLEPGSDLNQVNLRIKDFDATANYYLDTGSGPKAKVQSQDIQICYSESGVFLLKLIKENVLVDVMEVTIRDDGSIRDKLVSF